MIFPENIRLQCRTRQESLRFLGELSLSLNVATGYLGLWKPINILGNKVFLIQYHLVWCLKGESLS